MIVEPTTTEESPPVNTRRRLRGHHALLLVIAVAVVITARLRLFPHSSQAAPVAAVIPQPAPTAPAVVQPNAAVPLSPEEQLKQQLAGSWRDNYYGERTMTFHPDGTGIMVIKLNAAGQLIFGEKLKFDLAWTIDDGVLTMQFTGGEPKSAMATITKSWGDRHEQRIELLDDADLHLRSTDSGNLYQLKRLPVEE